MADKDTDVHQQPADVKAEGPLPIDWENNQEENEKDYSKAASTDKEINAVSQIQDSSAWSECDSEPPTNRSHLSPDDPSVLNSPADNTALTDKDRGDGPKTEKQQQEPSVNLDSDDNSGNEADGCEQADGPILNEESEVSTEGAIDNKPLHVEGKLESVSEKLEPQAPEEKSASEQTHPNRDIETIGPIAHEETTPVSDASGNLKGDKIIYLSAVAVIMVVVVAVLLQHLLQPESPPQKKDVCPIDVFYREIKKVEDQFPNQREELWKRSTIHLRRHFLIRQPTEPVSLILTAGVRAERTLHCLAHSLASALSSALNASVLHIEGASKASQDSNQVKEDIDKQLQKAFEADKPVAVIHHFEELPPASTLIFYRYCDHENAAFKKTFLIFTVLLGEVEEIPAKINLSAVEEMVDDHLQKKFLSHSHPTAFDKMDKDKYGGLWSRISHLILPVASEQRIKQTRC